MRTVRAFERVSVWRVKPQSAASAGGRSRGRTGSALTAAQSENRWSASIPHVVICPGRQKKNQTLVNEHRGSDSDVLNVLTFP